MDDDVDFTGVLAETANHHNLTAGGYLMSEGDQEELVDQEEEDLEDYGESFAEEFKLKQAKMLGEL